MEQHPRGIWIWRLSRLSTDHIDKLVQCKVNRVYLKVCDGRSNPMHWHFQCTPEIIQSYKRRNISVYGWGYHYGTDDVDDQVAAVKRAFDAGIEGYVVDVEKEVEDPSTHVPLRRLLMELREIVPPGCFGYTSFGNPDFHPKVPWKILDEICDLAFPQIYFEKFRFKATNEEEVQACFQAHHSRQLNNPILPIWGSESDADTPATAFELQQYLNRFPGSSLWRVPNNQEAGEALKLNYSGQPHLRTGSPDFNALPTLTRILKRRSQGDDVAALQQALKDRGFAIDSVDGDFGQNTERAVKAFQSQAALTVDGHVGPDTWAALDGSFHVTRPEQGVLTRLADIAQVECSKQLKWHNAGSEAEKYLHPLRAPMRQIGHIGHDIVFFDWCAAFVTWCCRKAGIPIPDRPEGFWATMALVETWKFWAKRNNFWHPAGSITPGRGDILVFEWFDSDVQLDHIGFARGYAPGSAIIETSEGNRGNISMNGSRQLRNVVGVIRIIA